MLNIKVVRDIPQKVPIFRRVHLAYHSTFTSVPSEKHKGCQTFQKTVSLGRSSDVCRLFTHPPIEPTPNQFRAQRLNQPIDSNQLEEPLNVGRNRDLFLLCLGISAASLKLEVYPTRNQCHLLEQRSKPLVTSFYTDWVKGILIMVDYNPNI